MLHFGSCEVVGCWCLSLGGGDLIAAYMSRKKLEFICHKSARLVVVFLCLLWMPIGKCLHC